MIPYKETFKIDDEFFRQRAARVSTGGTLIQFSPPEEVGDISDMQRFYTEFIENAVDYRVSPSETPLFGFEVHYDGDEIEYVFYTSDDGLKRQFITKLETEYEGGRVSEYVPRSKTGMKRFVPLNKGDYVSVAEMKLKHHFYEPIKNYKSNDDFHSPFPELFNQMVDERDTKEVIQILFKPYGTNWTDSKVRSLEGRANTVEQRQQTSRKRLFDVDTFSFGVEEDIETPDNLKTALKQIRAQAGKMGYFVNIRFASIADEEDIARKQLQAMAGTFSSRYRVRATGQTFVPNIKKSADIEDTLIDMIDRYPRRMYWPSMSETIKHSLFGGHGGTCIITPEELASIAHLISGDEDVSNSVKYSATGKTKRLPPTYGRIYQEKYRSTGTIRRRPWEDTQLKDIHVATDTVEAFEANEEEDEEDEEEPEYPSPEGNEDEIPDDGENNDEEEIVENYVSDPERQFK